MHVTTSCLEGHTTYTSEYQDVIEMTQSTEIHMNGSGSGSDTSELLAGAHCLRHQVNSNGIEQVFAVDNRVWQVNSDIRQVACYKKHNERTAFR